MVVGGPPGPPTLGPRWGAWFTRVLGPLVLGAGAPASSRQPTLRHVKSGAGALVNGGEPLLLGPGALGAWSLDPSLEVKLPVLFQGPSSPGEPLALGWWWTFFFGW